MHVVEENVSSATWLPRVSDFEGYTRLFEDPSPPSPECVTPMTDESDVLSQMRILEDKINGTNVPENSPSTPLVHRKPPVDGTRKSARKSKPPASVDQGGESPAETPPYKPRRSKYDLQ